MKRQVSGVASAFLGLAVTLLSCSLAMGGVRPVVSVAIAAGGSSCVSAAQPADWKVYDGPVVVSAGQDLIVGLGVPNRYDEGQGRVPWTGFESSDVNLVGPATLCEQPISFGGATEWSAFTAEKAGRAFLAADVSPAWLRSATDDQKSGIQPIQIEIDIQ